MELLAFMWLRDQDNALVYAIRLGDGVLEGVIALYREQNPLGSLLFLSLS